MAERFEVKIQTTTTTTTKWKKNSIVIELFFFSLRFLCEIYGKFVQCTN